MLALITCECVSYQEINLYLLSSSNHLHPFLSSLCPRDLPPGPAGGRHHDATSLGDWAPDRARQSGASQRLRPVGLPRLPRRRLPALGSRRLPRRPAPQAHRRSPGLPGRSPRRLEKARTDRPGGDFRPTTPRSTGKVAGTEVCDQRFT